MMTKRLTNSRHELELKYHPKSNLPGYRSGNSNAAVLDAQDKDITALMAAQQILGDSFPQKSMEKLMWLLSHSEPLDEQLEEQQPKKEQPRRETNSACLDKDMSYITPLASAAQAYGDYREVKNLREMLLLYEPQVNDDAEVGI